MRAFTLSLCLSLVLFGCPSAKRCDVTNCSTGCCDATGTCQLGDSASACGTGGALCVSCPATYCSAARVCGLNGSGGGTGTGGGGGTTGGRTVVFTNTWHQLTESGSSDVNFLGDAGVSLYIANGTTLTELPGTRTADRYTVPNVPAGPYVVRYSRSFFVASTDTFNRGSVDVGRADTRWIDAGAANLTLAVAGLPAWSDGDDLHLFSLGASFYGYGSYGLTSGPTVGMVPTSFSFDYGNTYSTSGAPAVSAAKGDSLYVAYMKNTFVAEDLQPGALEDGGTFALPFTCKVATSGARATNLEVVPGPNAAALTFTATANTPTALKYPRSQFAARELEVHPAAIEFYEELYVVAEPLPNSTSADLVLCSQYPDTSYPLTDLDAQVNVASPFPASWGRTASVDVTYRTGHTFPDAGTWFTRGYVRARAPVGTVVAPGVHSPTNLKVQGVAAMDLTTVSSAGPVVVTWGRSTQPPAATDFLVELVRMSKDSSGSTTRTTVTSALTRDTSFAFPVGFLTPGGVFFVRVSARVTASPEGAPYSLPVDSSATALSNAFIAAP